MKRTTPTKIERITAYSEALGRMRLANQLGVSYDGKRDLYRALGYPTDISYEHYLAKYKRQDIAASVIDKPIEITWRGDVSIEVSTSEETALEKAWDELYDRLKLKSIFQRVDKLSALGKYAILLLGLDDGVSTEAMALPITPGERKLIYIKPFSEGQANIANTITDPKDERYGLPLLYEVQINKTISIKVHYTRVLHVTGKILESETYGIPMMERVYNRLDDLEKITGGSAEMFWRGARPGYQGIVDKDFQAGATLNADLQEQMDEYENNLRRLIVNEGVEMKSLAVQVSNPTSHVEVQLQMISAATNIPKRILVGSERGELASTQDQTNWYDFIQVRREEQSEPNIIKPFITICQGVGILPKEAEGTPYVIKWEDLYTSSDRDKIEVGKLRTEALKNYADSPAAEAFIPPAMFLTHFLGLDDSTVEIIVKELEKLPRGEDLTEEEDIILKEENE